MSHSTIVRTIEMRVYKYRRDFDNDTSDPQILHRYTNYYYFIETLRENIFVIMYKLMVSFAI